MDEQIFRESLPWDRVLAVGSVLLVAIVTFFVARLLGRKLEGTTRLGLHGLSGLAGPLTLLLTALAGWLILKQAPWDPPILLVVIELVVILALFWLGARFLDVAWRTGRRSARLRRQPGAGSVLLAGRNLGKVGLALGAITVLAVRLGASEQLYIALGAIGAAFTFAARAPIVNAVAFAGLAINPMFRVGDRVRVSDFRRGDEAAEGEVIAMSLSNVTLRSKRRSLLLISNAQLLELRIENLSHADRRRLEFELPISDRLHAEKVRQACDAVAEDLRGSRWVSGYREPHVWIAGTAEGLVLRVSVWLRRGMDRRDAQRDLLLSVRSRFDELTQR